MPRMTKDELAAWLDTAIPELIVEYYKIWRTARVHSPKLPEPAVSAAYLREYFATQLSSSHGFTYETTRTQAKAVRASLGRLTRRGVLVATIGIGQRGGDARMYEPA